MPVEYSNTVIEGGVAEKKKVFRILWERYLMRPSQSSELYVLVCYSGGMKCGALGKCGIRLHEIGGKWHHAAFVVIPMQVPVFIETQLSVSTSLSAAPMVEATEAQRRAALPVYESVAKTLKGVYELYVSLLRDSEKMLAAIRTKHSAMPGSTQKKRRRSSLLCGALNDTYVDESMTILENVPTPHGSKRVRLD